MLRYFVLIITLLSLGCSSAPVECSSVDCVDQDSTMTKARSAQGGLTRLNPVGAVLLQSDLSPGMNTVQFGILTSVADQLVAGPIRTEAEIIWTVDNTANRRLISVFDGASISGVGDTVNVTVKDVSVSGTALDYTVQISVANGGRPSKNQPPIYEDTAGSASVAPGGTSTLNIPLHAGVISVHTALAPIAVGGTINAYEVLVEQLNGAGAVIKQYDPRQEFFMPLSPGAVQLRVRNAAATAQNINYKHTWGIDG